MKQKECLCECLNNEMIEDMCNSIVALEERLTDLQAERDEQDYVAVVHYMNKWRRKYKKAFKDAESFWRYYHKELLEKLEGDYEIEETDDTCGCECWPCKHTK